MNTNEHWRLYLDDLCRSPGSGRQPRPLNDLSGTQIIWRLAESVDEALTLIEIFGFPSGMSLDFDLGVGPTGSNETTMRFLREWTERYEDRPLPPYVLHTANPVGREQMQSFIISFNRSLVKDML